MIRTHNYRPIASSRLATTGTRSRSGSDRLLNGLRARLAWENTSDLPAPVYARAYRDAEALASTTGFPHLFLPELLAEKLRAARAWQARQEQILGRGPISLAE